MATSRSQRRRQPVRSSQSQRPGPVKARTIEPPDYTRDYGYVRRDLIQIAIIGGLLFAGMVAASFFV